jgi:hypothetical protein
VEVVQHREDEPEAAVLHGLMAEADMAIPFDCADRRVQFVVRGWFVFPKGSLTKPHDIKEPA